MAHFSYESVWILFNIIILLMLVLSIKTWGDSLSELFSLGSTGLVQEHISSFTSMVLIAPKYFYVKESFPPTNHTVKLNNGLVYVTPQKTIFRIFFEEEEPFPFIHDNNIQLYGECVETEGCQMEGIEGSLIIINKTKSRVKIWTEGK